MFCPQTVNASTSFASIKERPISTAGRPTFNDQLTEEDSHVAQQSRACERDRHCLPSSLVELKVRHCYPGISSTCSSPAVPPALRVPDSPSLKASSRSSDKLSLCSDALRRLSSLHRISKRVAAGFRPTPFRQEL
eukprot:5452017-Pleurochrysis_carterae.AAC.2